MTTNNNNIKQQPLVGEVVPSEQFLFNYKQLQPNQLFKNYKALCDYLGVEPKNGKAKQLQEKEWQRYFSWNKQGHKIIITSVYYIPLEKVDNRKNNTFAVRHEKESYFNKTSEVTTTIMEMCLKKCDLTREHIDYKYYKAIPIKTHDFYCEVGYCSPNYKTLADLHGSYSSVIPKKLSKFVFELTSDNMRQFSKTALAQMKKQKLLNWSYSKAWVEHIKDDQGNVIDIVEHIATLDQKGKIMEGTNHAFNLWNETYPNKQLKNIYSIYTVLNKYERQQIFEWAKEYIKETIPTYEYSYSIYEVIFIPQVIIRELLNRGFTEEELFDNQDSEHSQIGVVNDKFIDHSVSKIHDKFDDDMKKHNQWLESKRPSGLHKNYQEPKRPYITIDDKVDYDITVEFAKGMLDRNGRNAFVNQCIKVANE